MNTFFLANTQLFRGIREDEIAELLLCLGAYERKFQKGDVVFRSGSPVDEFGLVASGSVNIVVNLYWGNSIIFGHVGKGEVFAENYAVIPGKELLCDVIACEDTHIIFLNVKHVLTTCRKGCTYHNRIIQNMLRISAQKKFKHIFSHDTYRFQIFKGKAPVLFFRAGLGTRKRALYHPL